MPVDSRNKRFSMLGLAFPAFRVLHDPDGTDAGSNNERIGYLYLYEGIEPSGAGAAAEVQRAIYKWTRGTGWH